MKWKHGICSNATSSIGFTRFPRVWKEFLPPLSGHCRAFPVTSLSSALPQCCLACIAFTNRQGSQPLLTYHPVEEVTCLFFPPSPSVTVICCKQSLAMASWMSTESLHRALEGVTEQCGVTEGHWAFVQTIQLGPPARAERSLSHRTFCITFDSNLGTVLKN